MSSTADTLSTSSTIANIRRVSNDMVNRQFTAKQLIGKDVYDNRDKKIGEVKDVVLDTSRAQQLASALVNKASDRSASSSMSGSSTGTTASSATTSGSGAASTATGQGYTSSSSTLSGMAGMMNEPAAIISFGGFMGVGNNLLHVPLSQLRYDSSRDHLTLNVTETELSSLKDVTDTTRSATE